ncbi:11359_t:CDS:2, partial [Funneliformis caledonium]
MTREKHKLSGYFLILEEKSNKWNNYAICQDCIRVLGSEEASKHKFTNTKRAYANHLKTCPYWAERPTSEQTIIEKEGDEGDERGGRDAFQLTFHTPLPQLPLSRNLNNFFYTTPSITSHRSSLSGRILERTTNKISETILNDAINDDLGVMLAFDRWKNVACQNLLGS